MKSQLIGGPEHRELNKLTLVKMTENQKSGANHIVGMLPRFLIA